MNSAHSVQARETLSRAGISTPISDEELASIAERASRQVSRTSSVSHLSSDRLNKNESISTGDVKIQKASIPREKFYYKNTSSSEEEEGVDNVINDNNNEWKEEEEEGVNHASSSRYSDESGEDNLSLPSVILAELASPRNQISRNIESGKTNTRVFEASSRKGSGQQTSAVHHEYMLRIEQLAEQLEQALNARKLVEVEAQRKIRDAGESVQRAQQEASASIMEAKASKEASEAAEKKSKEFLSAARSQIADAISSAAIAVSGSAGNLDVNSKRPISPALQLLSELQHLPLDALSPRQFVQLTVLEHLMSIQARCDALNRSLEQRDSVLESNRSSAEHERVTLSQKVAIAQSREAHANERTILSEATSSRLQSKVDAVLSELESCKAKASAFDALCLKKSELESNLLQQTEQVITLTTKLEALQEDRNVLNSRVDAQNVRIEMLLTEKLSALASLEETRSRCKSLEDNADRLESLAREAAKSRDALSDQLIMRNSADYNSSGALEERVESELRRFRDEREHHMEAIRLERSELHDREIRGLREARTEAVTECIRLRDLIAVQKTEASEIRLQLVSKLEQAESIAADSKAQFKLRSLEFEQLRAVHSDTLDQLQVQSSTNDILRDKLSLVTTEFARLEAISEKQQAGLSARLEAEKARIEDYEAMESKLDEVVLASAAASTSSSGMNQTEPSHPDNIVHSLAIPSSSQRRMQQAISLARDLLSAKAEIFTLQTRNETLKAMCDQARLDSSLLRKQLDAVDGPQEYFIHMLRDREDDVKKAREETIDLRLQLSSAQKLGNSLASAKDKAEGEVRLLRDKLSTSATVEANLRASLLESSFVKAVTLTGPPIAGEPTLLHSSNLHGGGSPTTIQRSQKLSNTTKLESPNASLQKKRIDPSASEFVAVAPLTEGILINSESMEGTLEKTRIHGNTSASTTTLNFFTVNSVDAITAGGGAGGREVLKPVINNIANNVVVRAIGTNKNFENSELTLPRWFKRS